MSIGKVEERNILKKLYIRIGSLSFSSNIISPLIPYLLVKSHGSSFELGLFQALNNLFTNIGQVIWGWISDVLGKRRIMLSLACISIFFSSSLYLILMLLNMLTPYAIIAISTLSSLLASASAPVIASIIADIVHPNIRNYIYAIHSNISNIAIIIGNIFSIIILSYISDEKGFIIIMLVSIIMSSISSFFTFSLPSYIDKRKTFSMRDMFNSYKNMLNPLKNTFFREFLHVNTLYNFFLSIAWPLFPISQIKIIGMSPSQIMLLSLTSNITVILGQYYAGRYISKERYRLWALINRLGLTIVPMVYAFSKSPLPLYLLNIYVGILLGIGNVIFTMYIVDISPSSERTTYIGLYNTALGLASFIGSFIGGSISTILMNIYGEEHGLRITYYICTLARLVGAINTYRSKKHLVLKKALWD